MKIRSLSLCWPAMAVFFCCGLALNAAEKKSRMPKLETITGTLTITKDVDEKKKEKITKVELTTKDKLVYQVALLKNGRKLGGEKGDGEFEVTGYVVKNGNINWLTVKSYKKVKVEEPEEAEEKGKAAAKPEEKDKGKDKLVEKEKAPAQKKVKSP